MTTRQLIGYGLLAVLVIVTTLWVVLSERRKRAEIQRRHGPRED